MIERIETGIGSSKIVKHNGVDFQTVRQMMKTYTPSSATLQYFELPVAALFGILCSTISQIS